MGLFVTDELQETSLKTCINNWFSSTVMALVRRDNRMDFLRLEIIWLTKYVAMPEICWYNDYSEVLLIFFALCINILLQ